MMSDSGTDQTAQALALRLSGQFKGPGDVLMAIIETMPIGATRLELVRIHSAMLHAEKKDIQGSVGREFTANFSRVWHEFKHAHGGFKK